MGWVEVGMRGAFIVAAVLFTTTARADETSIVLDGVVPRDDAAFFTVPFEVPKGIVEIEVRHSDGSEITILDWGLIGPDGFRGWGGGNEEPAIVAEAAASRSYSPGPIEPGTWEVLVGKARLDDGEVDYALEVILRDEATLQPRARTPYEAPVLRDEPGWYAGDIHVHSLESGDARPPLSEIATYARDRGLDFVTISDHNVHTALDFMNEAQARHPELLFVPGVEFTTYAGHANGVGATDWVDFRVGVDGHTIDDAVAQFHAQDALFVVNHPVLDLGPLCIGCTWEQTLDPSMIDGVELTNGGGLQPFGWMFVTAGIAYWDELCSMGHHIAPLGGSDDHKAGVDLNQFQSQIGDGTTVVEAANLSPEAIVEGIRAGRTVVKLQGPGDPMIVFDSEDPREGDTVRGESIVLTATVTGGDGTQVRLVHDGEPGALMAVRGDPFETSWTVQAPAQGQARYRVEVFVDGSIRTLTSHLWVEFAEEASGSTTGAGTTTGDGVTTSTTADPSTTTSSAGSSGNAGGSASGVDDDGGCRVGGAAPWWLFVLPLLARRRDPTA